MPREQYIKSIYVNKINTSVWEVELDFTRPTFGTILKAATNAAITFHSIALLHLTSVSAQLITEWRHYDLSRDQYHITKIDTSI